LTRSHIKDWMASRTDISPKTLGNILSPLRIALNEAVEDGFIDLSPLAGWRIKRLRQKSPARARRDGSLGEVQRDARGRVRRVRYRVDPFSIEEQFAILHAMEGQNRNLIQFAFWTGLRTSELCGLDWTDIDWMRGTVYVRFVLTRGMEEPEQDTKTEAGEREVKLPSSGAGSVAGTEEFHISQESGSVPEPENRRTMDGTGAHRCHVAIRSTPDQGALSQSVSDPTHLRIDVTPGRRAPAVGCHADGPHRLDLHGPDLFALDQGQCAGCRQQGGSALVYLRPQSCDQDCEQTMTKQDEL